MTFFLFSRRTATRCTAHLRWILCSDPTSALHSPHMTTESRYRTRFWKGLPPGTGPVSRPRGFNSWINTVSASRTYTDCQLTPFVLLDPCDEPTAGVHSHLLSVLSSPTGRDPPVQSPSIPMRVPGHARQTSSTAVTRLLHSADGHRNHVGPLPRRTASAPAARPDSRGSPKRAGAAPRTCSPTVEQRGRHSGFGTRGSGLGARGLGWPVFAFQRSLLEGVHDPRG